MTIDIDIRGLANLERFVSKASPEFRKALPLAINDTLRYAGRTGSSDIRDQINVGRNYIGDARSKDAKLRITRYASANNPEGVLAARDNAVSLARFAVGKPTFGRTKRGPKVRVKTGSGGETIRRGFFVKLPANSSAIEAGFNLGLAVRLKPGEKIDNKRVNAKPLANGVFLLYGPSVAQVFQSVGDDIQDPVASYLVSQVLRQVERLARG